MEFMAKVFLEDILYTSNGKGPYKTSKVGEKYDNRRGRTYKVFSLNIGWLEFLEINEDGEYTGYGISTTMFNRKYTEDGFLYLVTDNSIYKCKPID